MIRYTQTQNKNLKLKDISEVHIDEYGGYNVKIMGVGRICYTNAKIKRISVIPNSPLPYVVTLKVD